MEMLDSSIPDENSEQVTMTTVPDLPPTPSDTTLLREIRRYPKIVAYSFGLALAFLLTGYDTAIQGTITAVPYFKREFGELYDGSYIIPSSWLSIWSAIAPIGSMIGAAVAGWQQDRTGRRWSLALSCETCAAGIAITFCSNLPNEMGSKRGVFLVGRAFQGWGVGGAIAGAQTYISETLPTNLRGSAMALCPIFMLFGELIGAGVIFACEHIDASSAYLTPFGTQWITTVLPFILAILLPESPSYLLRTEQHDKAHRAMKSLHTATIDVAVLLEEIHLSIIHEKQESSELSYIECFKGTNRRRTTIVAFSFMMPSLFGVPLLASTSYFMQVVGMSSRLSIAVLILGIVLGLCGNAVGIWLLSRVGQHRLMLVTLAVATVIWLSMGIAGCWSGSIVIWSALPYNP